MDSKYENQGRKPPGNREHLKESAYAQPWEMFPTETPESFWCFQRYRDMAYPNGYSGVWQNRSLFGCSEICHSLGYPISPGALGTWSSNFEWQSRVRAFDVYLDRAVNAGTLDEIARLRRMHLRRLGKAGEFAEQQMDVHLRRGKLVDRPNEPIAVTKPTEALEFLIQVTKTERLILGETTDNPGSTPGGGVVPVMDVSGMSLDELRQIEALRKKHEKR